MEHCKRSKRKFWLGNGGGGAGGSILFTGNLNNKGVIETKYGDKNTSVGYASEGGGNGVIAWFGYRTGVIPQNCLSHHHWKNTSFIVDGREKQVKHLEKINSDYLLFLIKIELNINLHTEILVTIFHV